MTLTCVKAGYFVLWQLFMCVCVCVCVSLFILFWYLSRVCKSPLDFHVVISSEALGVYTYTQDCPSVCLSKCFKCQNFRCWLVYPPNLKKALSIRLKKIISVSRSTVAGLPRSGKKFWKMKNFPGQGKVRELHFQSGKL